MLGDRAFAMLGHKPYYPVPTDSYPWDWIMPMLRNASAQELMRRVAEWPPAMQLPITTHRRRRVRSVGSVRR
jgi:hypothetical protein